MLTTITGWLFLAFWLVSTVCWRSFYDVSADGQRFLVNTVVDEGTSGPITLVVNWPALLKK